MNWTSTLERVVANQKALTPGKVLLTIITLPFLLVGWTVGCAWLILSVFWAAFYVGMQQARELVARDGGG